MKRLILSAVAIFAALASLSAQAFETNFTDNTLRIDYTFAGNSSEQYIALRELSATEGWWGRRVNLSNVPLEGNGDLTLYDVESGAVLYKTSFSSLFQEWITTPEASTISKSFEFTLLVPMPKSSVVAELVLRDNTGKQSKLRHTISPEDRLIRDRSKQSALPYEYLHKGGDSKEAIDVVILAEGYTTEEMDIFMKDAQITTDEILSYEPFKSHKDKFNFIAVKCPSIDSNVSVPQQGAWRETAVGSNFLTFYMDRYLTSGNVYAMYDLTTNIPCEHFIILANTDTYGGGGIYNSYTLTTAHHRDFRPVVVHEFGHSFGGLGDEYFYDNGDNNDEMHSLTHEPWEPNITTLVDFESKWADMVDKKIEIPTQVTEKRTKNYTVGVYEGGGYRTKGIYRPTDVCRMRNNTAERFCPVCERALTKVILHQTVDQK
ncbi:MAG: peptidase M64 [Alistipes sp.]|nr:peptidase M64 [Alistipes sp.]